MRQRRKKFRSLFSKHILLVKSSESETSDTKSGADWGFEKPDVIFLGEAEALIANFETSAYGQPFEVSSTDQLRAP